MTSSMVKFRLIEQDVLSFLDAEEDAQLHKASLIPIENKGYVLASCFSDNPNELKLASFGTGKLELKTNLVFPDYIVNLLCIQLTIKEKEHIKNLDTSFEGSCLLAVLTSKAIYFYNVSQGKLIIRFERFFPRGLKYIPLELKRPSSRLGCDGLLAIITVGKVFIFDWMRRKLVMNIQTQGISDLDFCKVFNGSLYFAGVLSTYHKVEQNSEDDGYGQLMSIYNLKTKKAIKTICLESYYGSYNLLFTEICLEGGSRKGLFLCLVNSTMQIVWNLNGGGIIFKSTQMVSKIQSTLAMKPIASHTQNALRMKEINGFGAIYELKVDGFSNAKDKSEDLNQMQISVESIKSPKNSKIISYFESECGNIVFSGIDDEGEQKQGGSSPVLSLYEISLN